MAHLGLLKMSFEKQERLIPCGLDFRGEKVKAAVELGMFLEQ